MICGRKSQRWYRQHKQHFWWAFVYEIWRVYFTEHCLTLMKAHMELIGKIIQLFILTYCCYRIIASKAQILQFFFLEQKPEFVRANESAQCEINKHFVHAFAERPIRISVTFFLFNNPFMTSNRYCIWIFARYPIYIVSEYLLLPSIKHCWKKIWIMLQGNIEQLLYNKLLKIIWMLGCPQIK